MSRMGKVCVDQIPGEVCTIASDPVKVIYVGRVVEFFDQCTVLLNRRGYNQDVKGTLRCSAGHFSPFRLSTCLAGVAGAKVAQSLLAVIFLKRRLNLPRCK